MIDYTLLCKGICLNETIAQKIICEIFAGEEVPTWIGDIANQTYEFHEDHGGILPPDDDGKREIIIMWALNQLRRDDIAKKFSGTRSERGGRWRISTFTIDS